jgi:hypothetical protein
VLRVLFSVDDCEPVDACWGSLVWLASARAAELCGRGRASSMQEKTLAGVCMCVCACTEEMWMCMLMIYSCVPCCAVKMEASIAVCGELL